MGLDGWDGWDGDQKCSLFFFVFRYIKHFTHIYIFFDGLDGLDGHQKCTLIYFILRYIKHYTHIYLYTKEKLSGQISCGFIFWSSWRVAPTIFKITLLGRHFSKMRLKVDFLEKKQ